MQKILEVLCVLLLAGIAIWYARREQRHRDIQKKRQKLLMEYPEFVSKLSLLLGAGMSVSMAFRKLNQQGTGAVYEELQRMLYEIDNGMSELQAFQRFGERCNLQPYRRLVSLLLMGQRLGNRQLLQKLNEEADKVFTERKNMARKLGEEAGTKLIFPMMLMLLVVMGIVLFPAFLSISAI